MWLTDALRQLIGGSKKERSVFESERDAYDFCRQAYKKNGGVPPELRRAYEFYQKHLNDGCNEDRRPFEANGHPDTI